MSITNRETLCATVVREIARHPQGVGIDDLRLSLGPVLTHRTLQRRLAELVAERKLIAIGRARALRYCLATDAVPAHETSFETRFNTAYALRATEATYAINTIPVSATGQEVLDYVRRPIQGRKPVGYDGALLDAYQPNQTFYLRQEQRDHLRAIGRCADDRRPAGTYTRELLARLLIDLSWASSKLEGNTYSRLDTQNLIEHGQMATGKDRHETQMILNHKAAIEFLSEQTEDTGFNPHTLFNLHAILSEGLLTDPDESGRLRRRIVDISGAVYYPLGIPQLIEANFRLLLSKANAIEDPFEQSLFVMVHLPYLQPFVDVNKRVSRLAANIPLIRHNLCPLSFIDVPERAYVEGTLGVYELQKVDLLRDVFVWSYERSALRYNAVRAVVADPDPVRLRHRETLIAIVSEIVRALQSPDDTAVRLIAAGLVPAAALEQVTAMALSDLHKLHEGNIARYRLRRSEYFAWQARHNATPG